MAKQTAKQNKPPALPSLDNAGQPPAPVADIPKAVAEIHKPAAKQKAKAEKKPPKVTTDVCKIEMPVVSGLTGYARRRIDVSLSSSQAERLKSIQLGLEQKNAKLSNGRFVSSPAHVFMWLLEQ